MKAVGYRKSLAIEDAESLLDFEAAKPEPRALGRVGSGHYE